MLIAVTAAALSLSSLDPDGVVSTAPRGSQQVPAASQAQLEASLSEASPSTTVQSAAPHGMTTSEQIANWVGQGRQERETPEGQPWASSGEEPGPRKMHGEFSVGFGTEGYRDYAAAVALPIGESGTLSLSVRQTENNPYAYGYDGYGLDPYGRDRRFGLLEAPGYEGTYWRGRSLGMDPYGRRYGEGEGKSTSASIGLRLGQ